MTKFQITPPLLSVTPMHNETEELFKEFNRVAPKPISLQLSAFKMGEMSYGLGNPAVRLPNEKEASGIPLRNFPVLREMPLFHKLLHYVMADEAIERAVRTLQRHRDLNHEMGYLTLQVMPGALRLHHPHVKRISQRYLAQSLNSETTTKGADPTDLPSVRKRKALSVLPFENIGVYAAGKYASAHEQVSVTQKINDAAEFWKPVHDDFNAHEWPNPQHTTLSLGNPSPSEKTIITTLKGKE